MTVIHIDLDNIHKDRETLKQLEDLAGQAILDLFDGMEEYLVEVDCPYAQYVEFGSDPADPENKTQMVKDPICGDMVTETKLRFREWAQTKFDLSDDERKKRGDAIYSQVMEHGMKATPFMRPAKYHVTEDFMNYPDRYLEEGKNPIELLANELAARMAMQLESNESLVSGELKKSIHVVKASEASQEPPPDDLRDIQDYIWEDMSLDRHGNKIRKH